MWFYIPDPISDIQMWQTWQRNAFYRFFAPWREQSNTGNDKNQRVLMHVRRSVDNVHLWPLQHRHSFFLWLFHGRFSMVLSDFCIHGVSKAPPGTTKMNAFWCIFAGRSTACVWRISWRIKIKLGRKQKMINFRAICKPRNDFFTFSRDLEKNVFKKAICEYG